MHVLVERLHAVATRPWRIMEVCGGQTFTLSRYRLEELLPSGIRMIHGPGCPVCVTPAATIDTAIALAQRPEVTLCSFGDMLRVPGSNGSLLRAKAAGADIRLLYSPLEALRLAQEMPEREVVFFAIGFETTMPAYCIMAEKAVALGLTNLSLLTSLFTVPAAVRAVVTDPACQVDALLAAGHVCAVMGVEPYEALSRELGMPIVITGFEPVDMLLGILRATEMLEQGATGVVNAYGRVVHHQGTLQASAAIRRVMEPCDAYWRGLGLLKNSGMKLRKEYEQVDAWRRYNINIDSQSAMGCRTEGEDACIAHLIMKGLRLPKDCPNFGHRCRPDSPVGAPMVSNEGVCAAYFKS